MSRTEHLSLLLLATLLSAGTSARMAAQTRQTPAHAESRAQQSSAPTSGTMGPKTEGGAPSGEPAKPPADYSREPVVYEYRHTVIRFENDGTGARETRGRVHVQTAAGVAYIGQFVFEYNGENETAEVTMRVIKPDGSVVVAGPDNIQDLSAPIAREAPMYTDARQKHVSVPGLSVGDFIEYDVKISSRPLLAGQFWESWDLKAEAICLDEQVQVEVPRGRALRIKGPPDLPYTVKEEDDRRIYHWSTANLDVPNVKDLFKNRKIDVETLLVGLKPKEHRHVSFSTFQSWSEVGKWYADLERERRVPNAEIRAKAHEIVKGMSSDIEKAQALYDWVTTNIRYVSLSFGVGRYQPHLASDVLTNRYGDCKDKSTLLESLFEAEGLSAQAVLIHSNAEVDLDVPAPTQFDHAITFATIGGKDNWLDTTIGAGPFGYLLPQLRGRNALVVFTNSPPEIRQTPKALPMETAYRLEIHGKADSGAKLAAEVSLIARGDLEVLIRLLYSHMSPAQFGAFMEQWFLAPSGILYGDPRFSDFTVENAADLANPVRARFHAEGKLSYVNLLASSGAGIADGLSGAFLLDKRVLSLLPQADSPYSSAGKPDASAIQLGGANEYSLSVVLEVPNVKPGETANPPDTRISNDFSEYESRASWEDQTLHASWKLKFRGPEIPASASKEYSEFRRKIIDSLGAESTKNAKTKIPAPTPVSITAPTPIPNPASSPAQTPSSAPPPVAATPVHVPAPDAAELYKRGSEEARRKNFANAAESFDAALKIDPVYADAWRDLGRAQMYERLYGDAEHSFRRYLELDSENSRAYLNMAWVLYAERKYGEDAELLEKRIVAAPRDGDAHARLAAAYLALHKPDLAVPVAVRATMLLPKYPFAYLTLGRAYLDTHQDDKAADALQHLITLDDSEAMLNTAAYLLAEHVSSLDLAEKWVARAISVVELELNQVTLKTMQGNGSALAGKAAAYWDTAGWIKFQMGELASAEKYLEAAWQLGDDSTIGSHLGRVYEASGRKNDAIEIFAQTLALVPASREYDPNEDEKKAREHLLALLGSDPLVDARIKEARTKKARLRAVSVANSTGAQGIAQYTILIGPGSKIADLALIGTDDSLAGLTDGLRAVALPQSFPDATIERIPRVGTLACASADQPCSFTLISAGAASRVLPTD
jgi:tetratricopeptide (TPR) repeat protein